MIRHGSYSIYNCYCWVNTITKVPRPLGRKAVSLPTANRWAAVHPRSSYWMMLRPEEFEVGLREVMTRRTLIRYWSIPTSLTTFAKSRTIVTPWPSFWRTYANCPNDFESLSVRHASAETVYQPSLGLLMVDHICTSMTTVIFSNEMNEYKKEIFK